MNILAVKFYVTKNYFYKSPQQLLIKYKGRRIKLARCLDGGGEV